jgi:hypothetical protein
MKSPAPHPQPRPRSLRSLSHSPEFSGLGPRGSALWSATADEVVGERGLLLLLEACRIADRLERLDEILRGEREVWATLVHNLRTEDYELRIDSALVEARQQANVLRQLIVSLPLKEAPSDGDDDGAWVDDVPA